MRKSERLRELEISVVRMEMHIELLTIALNNLLESQEMKPESNLDAGKWYTKPE